MLWIRIGFHADPEPAFFLNADPDPDPGQTLSHKHFNFDMENKLEVGKGLFTSSWIRIRIHNITIMYKGGWRNPTFRFSFFSFVLIPKQNLTLFFVS